MAKKRRAKKVSDSDLDLLVRRLADQRRRAASSGEAIRRARKAIHARGQFIPKQLTQSSKPTLTSF